VPVCWRYVPLLPSHIPNLPLFRNNDRRFSIGWWTDGRTDGATDGLTDGVLTWLSLLFMMVHGSLGLRVDIFLFHIVTSWVSSLYLMFK
jgi:hypothetical protein